MALYDEIGTGYDETRRPDPRIVERLALGLRPVAGRRYLDLACGTGNYTCAMARRGGDWSGIGLRDYFPRMFERIAAKEPSEAEILADLRAVGLDRIQTEAFDVPHDLVDHFLYSGKHRPELYFDAAIRAGISSFANLCEPEEVAEGLKQLRGDLIAGRRPLPDSSGDPPGDYVLIIASSGG